MLVEPTFSAPPVVATQRALSELCARLQDANVPVAFDTEFLSERRYAPKLCLVQLYAEAESGPIEALVDPFATPLDALLPVLTNADITKIVHSGGQDLQIFAALDAAPRNVFDTQIAAAFLGYGHQIGYADLVKRTTGETLSKAQQFTDWAARPLSPEQRAYALDDVRYLPRIQAQLARDLEARGRLSWATSEFSRLERRASAPPNADDLLRKFNLVGLSRRGLATLRELALWRELAAKNSDKPATFIVPDATLLQIAKHPPTTVDALRATRGLPSLANAAVQDVLKAIARAQELPPEELPERAVFERPDARAEAVTNLLSTLAALRADEQQISRAYLAPRDQLAALANWWVTPRDDEPAPPALPVLSDWRRALVGDELLRFLNGELALTVEPQARLDTVTPAVRIENRELRMEN